ncbi:MAG: helicase/exodeoxyribonuclease subunit [Bryobacterales bacterium]|nr:helicase/exodeoxyribonuclease subunit [Bryobacterales bacterium]
MTLSDDQRRAAERAGQDVCVVAGPGSGKTRVLTERFAWLVETHGVDPDAILAITFTEKAANEIKSRLIQRFAGRPEAREAIERAWVSTIHGLCARVLQENAICAGLPPDFKVLDQSAADRMEREAAEATLDAMYREQPERMRRLLEALDLSTQDDGRQPDLAESLVVVYESMRSSGVGEIPTRAVTPDCLDVARELAKSLVTGPMPRGADGPRLREWAARFLAQPDLAALARFDFNLNNVGRNAAASRLKNEILPVLQAQWIGEWYADLRDLLCTAIARIEATYRTKKRQESAVDFADLEEFTVALLESDEAVQLEVSGRFEHMLMDELQDTNRLQWRLINLLRTSFFGVGDINQSIYGFRYADPEVFAEYRDELRSSGAEIDELKENHRSRAVILATVSAMLDGQPGIEARPLEAHAKFEPVGVAVERLVGRGEEPQDIEAALVAARIRQFVDGGEFRFRDIAVLVRTLSSTAPFERGFDRLGIPFLLTGGRTFLEARETRDLLALLAALVNPLDEIPLVGVLRGPLVGLSDLEIYRMGREAWRAEFDRRFGRIRELAGFLPPDRLIAMALDQCGYTTGLADRCRANVEKLLAWLRREFRDRPRPLAELLEDLEALRWTQSVAEAPPPDAGDVVRMMTIHAAKGLEFPVVFVSALHRGPDRRKPVIAVSRESGLGIKWRHPTTGQGHSDSVHRALIEQIDLKEKAEENRLLYVAMTRAQDRLILSHAEGKRASAWQKLAESAVPESAAPPEPAASGFASAGATEEVLDPPVVSGQYDSAASVTSVAMFQACPRKYYLSRYLGLEPTADRPGTGAIELGLDVHGALAGQTVESAEANELASRFRLSDLGRRAQLATRIEREFDFLIEIDDVVVRGQIDLWFEEGGELVLVDYKTDRDELGTEGYALQLRLYALALERYAARRPDRAVLYYLRSNGMVEIGLGDSDLAAVRNAVRQLREAQDRLQFPLKIGEQCRRCTFWRGICPAGKDEGVRPEAVSVSWLPSFSPGPPTIGS